MTPPESPPNAEYINLDLNELVLDPGNPRFADYPLRATDPYPELAYLARNSNLTDLMRSIGAQGFFPGEPVMAVWDEERQKYVVIEGNRRTAACILLANPDRAPEEMAKTASSISKTAAYTPELIPTLVFSKAADIHRYLGYRHISGVQEWSPQAKALYLRTQYSELNDGSRSSAERLSIVAERIGNTPTYAARLLTSLAIFEMARSREFFGLNIDAPSVSFSLITVAITRRPINQYLNLASSKDFSLSGVNETALANIFDWLFVKGEGKSTVLRDSRNMGKLAEILQLDSTNGPDLINATRDLDETLDRLRPAVNEIQEILAGVNDDLEYVTGLAFEDGRPLDEEEVALAARAMALCRRLVTGLSENAPAG